MCVFTPARPWFPRVIREFQKSHGKVAMGMAYSRLRNAVWLGCEPLSGEKSREGCQISGSVRQNTGFYQPEVEMDTTDWFALSFAVGYFVLFPAMLVLGAIFG